MRLRHRGAMLIDMLVAALVMSIMGAAMATLLAVAYRTRDIVQGANDTDARARQTMNALGDAISNAQSVTAGGSAAALSQADATSLTCYTSSGANTAKYWLDTSITPYALKKTVDGKKTTTLMNGVKSLSFAYYVAGGAYAATTNSWVTCANANKPTSAELPKVGGIQITLKIQIDNATRDLTTIVRLRNSPQ